MNMRAWAVFALLFVGSAAAIATPEEQMQAGMQSYRSGHFGHALEQWKAAAATYEAGGYVDYQMLALTRAAEAALSLGRNAEALELLQRALAVGRANDRRTVLPSIENALGTAHMHGGRFAEAERALLSSAKLARDARNAELTASALNNLGNLFAAQARFDEAFRTYAKALDVAQGLMDKALAARVSINLARAQLDAGRDSEAIATLAHSTEHARRLAVSHEKAYDLIAIGRLYVRILASGTKPAVEWSRRANAALRQALEVADSINDVRARSYALGYLGELYERGARSADALQLTQAAIAAAHNADAPDALYRWHWQAGRLQRAHAEHELAIQSYQQAVATLAGVRPDLAASALRASFRESIAPVYSELAELLLDSSERAGDPKRVSQYLVDARSAMELLKGAELQDYFQDDCVAELRARTTGIDQLAPQTAALYPIILKDRLELLLTLPDGIRRFTTRVDAATLTKEVRAFRTRLERKTTHQYYPHARQLYDWLIRPIAGELEKHKIDTLVIVPDGALRTIPLAALHDGDQFLIARYAMATTPGLTLTDPKPLARERAQLMLNGLTEPVQGFAPLPYVAEELESIQKIYGGTVLQNKQFTIPNMEKGLEATPYSIVHIASHGHFDRDIEKSFVLTYEDKLSLTKLEQFLGLSKYRSEAVELLTLSACETAAGDDRAALGLAGVAIKAGARSALASLWMVNDPASAAMVSHFYRELRDPAISKAKALQQAQLALLNDLRYRHPNYWGAFLLIGNWL